MTGTTGNTMSLYDVFNNMQNQVQYSTSAPAFNYTPEYLGTRDDLLNGPSGTQQVQRSIQSFLDPNSAYLQNARQRGVEQAATRGGINSSIAAGASERAAMEAIQPFVNQAVQTDQQKYQLMGQDYLAQQGYKAQAMLAQQQANTENWLSQQNFGRAMFGQTFSNSMGMLNLIQQYALDDPELYTPEVMSGYTNFFQQNMNDLLSRYFGGG